MKIEKNSCQFVDSDEVSHGDHVTDSQLPKRKSMSEGVEQVEPRQLGGVAVVELNFGQKAVNVFDQKAEVEIEAGCRRAEQREEVAAVQNELRTRLEVVKSVGRLQRHQEVDGGTKKRTKGESGAEFGFGFGPQFGSQLRP